MNRTNEVFPAAPAFTAFSPLEVSGQREWPKGHILIVSDEPIRSGIHAGILGLEGYTTEIVDNAGVALRALATGDFDAVLADCRKPWLNGTGLIRRLREGDNQIPVVMLSGICSHDPLTPPQVTRNTVVLHPAAPLSVICRAVSEALGNELANSPQMA